MSRKTRIIISCILVLFAFGAGIFAYAQTYAGRMKNANAEAVTPEYFVDKFGKIELPAEPTYNPANPEEEKAVRSSRGTVDNPLFVLEIVPYDGMAEFGFMVAGQERSMLMRQPETAWNFRELIIFTIKQTRLFISGNRRNRLLLRTRLRTR